MAVPFGRGLKVIRPWKPDDQEEAT
jgi:hypothetical protein